MLKESAETENLIHPFSPTELTQQLGVCRCVIRGACVCVREARGHGTDNTEITILVYSSLSLRPPDGVRCGGGAHRDSVKNDPRQHVACDRVSSVRPARGNCVVLFNI